MPTCTSEAAIKKSEPARIGALYGDRMMYLGFHFFCESRFDPGGFFPVDDPFSCGPVERAGSRLKGGRLFLRIFLGLRSFNGAANRRFYRSIPLAGLFRRFHPFRSRFVFGQSDLLFDKSKRRRI